MRVTRSYACSQALAEAQTALLQAAEQVQAQAQAFALQVIENHAALENTAPLPTIVEDELLEFPLEPVISCCPSVSSVIAPTIPLLIYKKKVCLPLTGVKGLPVPGQKRRQEQYGVALCVQCVTLFDAGIPLDVITSR